MSSVRMYRVYSRFTPRSYARKGEHYLYKGAKMYISYLYAQATGNISNLDVNDTIEVVREE